MLENIKLFFFLYSSSSTTDNLSSKTILRSLKGKLRKERVWYRVQNWNYMNISEASTTCTYIAPRLLVYEECAARVDR